jgi:DNA-binding transcriptional ArsR family regulator
MCVSDLRAKIGRAHALVSHHVQVLRRAGLIRCTRRGRWSLLQLETARVAALAKQIFALGGETFPMLGPADGCLPGPLISAEAPGHVVGAAAAPTHAVGAAASSPRGGSVATGVAGAPSW